MVVHAFNVEEREGIDGLVLDILVVYMHDVTNTEV